MRQKGDELRRCNSGKFTLFCPFKYPLGYESRPLFRNCLSELRQPPLDFIVHDSNSTRIRTTIVNDRAKAWTKSAMYSNTGNKRSLVATTRINIYPNVVEPYILTSDNIKTESWGPEGQMKPHGARRGLLLMLRNHWGGFRVRNEQKAGLRL